MPRPVEKKICPNFHEQHFVPILRFLRRGVGNAAIDESFSQQNNEHNSIQLGSEPVKKAADESSNHHAHHQQSTYCIWSWWGRSSSQSSGPKPCAVRTGWGSTRAWCRFSCRILLRGQRCGRLPPWLGNSSPCTCCLKQSSTVSEAQWRRWKTLTRVARKISGCAPEQCPERGRLWALSQIFFLCSPELNSFPLTWLWVSLLGLASGSPGPAAAPAARGWACTPSLSAKSIPGRETSTESRHSKGYLQCWGLCYLFPCVRRWFRALITTQSCFHLLQRHSHFPPEQIFMVGAKKKKKTNKQQNSLRSSLLVFVLLTLFAQFALLALNDEGKLPPCY